jgi:photosystem II stability/assembly factor-like uncharacterized protein
MTSAPTKDLDANSGRLQAEGVCIVSELLVVGTDQGVILARREGDAWREAGRSLASHRITSLSVQGATILAGTRQGIHRSDDLGQAWQMASEGLADPHVRWLAHHPDGSGRVLAGTEPAAIYLSLDDGQTWAERTEVARLRDKHGWYLPYSPEAGCVRGFAFHGDRAYAAVEVGGLLRSDDRGETWQLAGGSSGDTRTLPQGHIHPDVHTVAVHPSSPDLVVAPTGGGFYRSEDGGATWQQLYHCYCRAAWSDPGQAGHLILGPADSVDRNGRIEETHDGGQTWDLASEGLAVPWPHHMVERFWQGDQELLAMLSNGELTAAPSKTLAWQRILAGAGDVQALALARL